MGSGRSTRGVLLRFMPVVCVVSSCSSTETAADGGSGGAAGGGTGGSEDSTPCGGAASYPSCVSSCGMENAYAAPVCGADKAWHCPAGAVDYSTCPPWTCARNDSFCCDPVTGQYAVPACGPDGLRVDCPAGVNRVSAYQCMPTEVGTTKCWMLDGMSCGLAGEHCWVDLATCTCDAGDGGLIWRCTIAPSP